MIKRQVIKIEGLRELDEALGELPKATGKNVLRRALLAGAEPIQNEAAELAPVLAGHLQRSVAASGKLTRRQQRQHKKESTVEIFVGAGGLTQATMQEFGTAHHEAQPFLRPAWDTHKMTALQIIVKALSDELEKARQRLARKTARLAAKAGAGKK